MTAEQAPTKPEMISIWSLKGADLISCVYAQRGATIDQASNIARNWAAQGGFYGVLRRELIVFTVGGNPTDEGSHKW